MSKDEFKSGIAGVDGVNRQAKCRSLLSLVGGVGGGYRAWSGCNRPHAGVVEDKSLDLSFVALGGEFLAVQQETYSCRVTDLDDDLAAGAGGSVGGSNQGLLGDVLSIGDDGDPGIFGGADDQFEPGRRFRRCGG